MLAALCSFMKIQKLSDIEKLPSVLGIEILDNLMVQLVEVIRAENISPLEGARKINDLISYCGDINREFSERCSLAVMKWTEETYDGNNEELTELHSANMVNMCREIAINFLEKKLFLATTDFERQELTNSLREIGVRT